jgi:hypothetical protein
MRLYTFFRKVVAIAVALAGGCPGGGEHPPAPPPPGAGSDPADAGVAPATSVEPLERVTGAAQGDGRGMFAAPSRAEQDAFAALVEEMSRAAWAVSAAPPTATAAPASLGLPATFEPLARWNARAQTLGFEVVVVRGRETFLVLREIEGIRRGGGVYALRPAPRGRPVVIQAPHSFFDEGTGALALDIFERSQAFALALNTVHRYLSKPKPAAGHAPSDLAHSDRSYFQAFTVGASRALERAAFVQIHGFGADAHAGLEDVDIVASKGDAAAIADPTFEGLVADLRALAGAERVAVYGREARVLGATTNVQGRFINGTSDDFFYHLELARSLRGRLERDAVLRARFAEPFRRIVEGPR